MPGQENTALPIPLEAYFAAEGHSTTLDLFANDAVVEDEGKVHTGAGAIGEWLASVQQRYQPRYKVQGAETVGERTVVTFEVSGTFPGSPAVLRQAITVRDGVIGRLQTL
ncbi:nuclear transport factor 2 family protein [Devosia sp. 2618]|uniref:nuclear transport factor 2 family protein n=1 Tax=Devosia sp. 2618 TaxID=3156454 RepID=UPI0033915D93